MCNIYTPNLDLEREQGRFRVSSRGARMDNAAAAHGHSMGESEMTVYYPATAARDDPMTLLPRSALPYLSPISPKTAHEGLPFHLHLSAFALMALYRLPRSKNCV